jgi:A/G-specific adenine glycosylase
MSQPPVCSPATGLAASVTQWYAQAARTLPWREPGIGAWPVLVSEVMLQQTPVARVLPAWQAWMSRWPTAADLAAASPGEAVRKWQRLGYPRRALRLHACAVAIVERFDGRVPSAVPDLESLPGVGTYTARAVAVFAFGDRHPVVDTNVRRVLARVIDGRATAAPPSAARDLAAAEAVLPDDPAAAARTSIALMELGALVCTARSPRCDACPLSERCAWRRAGWPADEAPRRPAQRFSGTDRQVRGLLLGAVRDADAAVPRQVLDLVWHDADQRSRALAGLVADGLLQELEGGRFALPA